MLVNNLKVSVGERVKNILTKLNTGHFVGVLTDTAVTAVLDSSFRSL